MRLFSTFSVALTGLALAAASSSATIATVRDIWPTQPSGGNGSEWNLYNDGNGGTSQGNGVMEYLYGNDFSRVTIGSSDPIQWMGLSGSANLLAVYAGYNQALYTTALNGSNPVGAVSGGPIAQGQGTAGNPPSLNGPVSSFTPSANPFLFLDVTSGGNAYSDPALNGGIDRMVTFSVSGYLNTPGVLNSGYTLFTKPTYVIGFEDGGDFDYNDLVVQVSGVTPVPEPTTIISGALMLLPFGASAVRILRRRQVA